MSLTNTEPTFAEYTFAQIEALLNDLKARREAEQWKPKFAVGQRVNLNGMLGEVAVIPRNSNNSYYIHFLRGSRFSCMEHELEAAPFTLSRHIPGFRPLVDGEEYHRQDFTEDMLPEGTRPLLLGERWIVGDQIFRNSVWMGGKMAWDTAGDRGSDILNLQVDSVTFHCRTRRPLPPPPDPEREALVPLEAKDVPPGSAFKRSDDSSWSLVVVCMKFAIELMDSSGTFNMTFQALKDEKYLILRPGKTEWQPCSKQAAIASRA